MACALFMLIGSGVHAQSDTSIFFKYAATFDQMLPSPVYPFNKFLPDSASMDILNAEPKSNSLHKTIELKTESKTTEGVFGIEDQNFSWDAEGRLINYAVHRPKDTVALTKTAIRYISGSNVALVLRVDPRNSWKYDSIMFRYNRSGWLGSWRYSSKSPDSAFVVNGTRMYDGKGRVIVATNVNYGTLKGSYTYEYDANGQLIRRNFLAGSSGVILCTDTLEYKYLTDSRSILQVSHKLKVTGMANWVGLERKTIYPY
ncbi:MAG TPA: hypothetical protein VK826_11790, partial [Bacteroidia bacterium]|nr:hypothetical protein [Bacteroidia bacterium]